MNQSYLLSELNPPQQEAVQHTEGPLLILAGAGSGKTRVLTYRIAYILAEGLSRPDQILAVTFTNKAANEMKSRIEKLIEIPVQNLWIGTFHSISARILHREARHIGYQANFTIYDTDDQETQIKRIMEFLNISREIMTPRTVQYQISDAKNKMMDAKKYEKTVHDFRTEQIAKIFWEYEAALKRNNAFDFDDLILKPIDIFTAFPKVLEKYHKQFRYVLVDEYQDTNRAQYYWVKLLSQKSRNICVVGDEDQSIYGWRGADIGNILNFESDYKPCKVVRLQQNYRSTQNILDAANAVVAKNVSRLGKKLWSKQGQGELIQVIQTSDERAEAYQVVKIVREEGQRRDLSYNDMVILYRTNAQSRALEEQFRRANIPYTIVGGIKFYERKEIKDILAYLKILVNPKDAVSLERIINFPTRGIGTTSLQYLRDRARSLNVSLYEVISNVGEIDEIKSGISAKIQDFYDRLEGIRKNLSHLNAYQAAEKIISEFELKKIYENSSLVEDETRLENIHEFLNSIEIFVSDDPENSPLSRFVDEISLLTDIDRWDADRSVVTLMTLHSAKGLEFPLVIITGLEDGLLPLSRNSDKPGELEEERRLFYVGMTRAKQNLFLLHAQNRHRFGREEFGSSFRSMPSRFLREIPEQFLKIDALAGSHDSRVREDSSVGKAPGDLYLARLPDESSDFKIGQYVQHEVFGHGQILGVEMTNLGTKLVVRFEKVSIKKLIAEYANLTISDSLE
ncbi:MAG: UvrD-helicase domain-containing protein [bacterium]|nr:MAG: UvrD-helicase domain-containing protein [bacterium]